MQQTIFTNKKCQGNCSSNGYLLKDNYLGEFITEVQKEKARKNLGLDSIVAPPSNYRIVNTIQEMTLLEDVIEGTLCYVIDDVYKKYFYQFKDGKWEEANITGGSFNGIPIYTPQMVSDLEGHLPEQYISLHSELEGYIEEKTYTTSINGSLADVLFSALRSLQSEVNRLKNSFKYGINSYNGTDTALSVIQNGFSAEDEEPLWAVEESDLSEVFTLETASQLNPSDNIDVTNSNIYKITGTSSWEDVNSLIQDDAKIVIYITSSNLNIVLNLTNDLSIDLNSLNIPKCQLYNIMCIISRRIQNKGDSYIWFSIDNPTNDVKLKEGYYNLNSIVDNKYVLDNNYQFNSVDFTDLNLSKFKVCSKYQDFTNSVISTKPSDQDYKYNVAHLTIRSVKNFSVLSSIKSQLQNGELIYVEESEGNNKQGLYIKTNNKIVSLSGTVVDPDKPEEPMDREELIQTLQELGIIYGDTLNISNIGDLTFIHQDSGNSYKVSIDAYGNLVSSKIQDETLEDRVQNSQAQITESTRGFVGQLGLAEFKKEVNNNATLTTDIRLYSDRIKIGAFYAPKKDLSHYGCSHAYIELENTSDKDFNLEGCYLHYAYPYNAVYKVEHLELNGIIPAGGTFVIRGKQYASFNDVNTFIKVETFDQEWYVNKQLIDLSYDSNGAYGFALTYGNPTLEYNEALVRDNSGPLSGTTQSKDPYLYQSCYIDSVYFNKPIQSASNSNYWTGPNTCMTCAVDAIFKNSFELDPAKQAFQGLTTRDSSRVRNASASDFYYIPLNKEYIEFPKSETKYKVSNFTPKASFEHKNVCTDKTKMDMNKPNMVTCAFGIDALTTRCFNWVSAGVFDEYIWIKKQGESEYTRFESYKPISEQQIQDEVAMTRKEFSPEINNTIYARITSRFPADNTLFTVHKCIIQIVSNAPSTPQTYTYIVGRADKNGNPDLEHTSEEYTFTMYPSTYKPVIYQTTDQQGFHWVEYQVWNAVANNLENDIKSNSEQIIPILLNTGDMTQSGARINEWLDYYEAGKNLFKQYEQMNVVGNNDLCGTIPTELGTGDDAGKSNSYYFHLFYCYEINPNIPPIVNGKYIPSLYYVDFPNYRLVMVNSEITYENCNSWFNLHLNPDANDLGVVNIYTGWRVPSIENSDWETYKAQNYCNTFTSIYTMLYKMTETDKKIIVACHEMPFTVITAANLLSSTVSNSRSLSGTSLVGSHLNQLNSSDNQSNYWFSRLLEFRNVKLCLGGHKHTYAVTYPLREYYFYGDNKNSKDHGPMLMNQTLENDKVTFVTDNPIIMNNKTGPVKTNCSKFPLMLVDKGNPIDDSVLYPYTKIDSFVSNADVNHTDGVVYFMCQASGFKLFSNKELPSIDQKFSQFLPKSTVSGSTYKASSDQRSPMYARIELSDTYSIKLMKLLNIQSKPTVLLTPLTYGTSPVEYQYLINVNSDTSATEDEKLYGKWSKNANNLLEIL